MSYIDYRKSHAKILSEDDIIRDKEALTKVIMSVASQRKEDIVNRLYEIKNIGMVDAEKQLIDIVKEAEWLYGCGFFLGCISIVGLVAEEFSKLLAAKYNISKNSTQNQTDRIKKLKIENKINEDTASKLDFIRIIRNKCIHFKDSFSSMDETQIKENALKAINYFKEIMADSYVQDENIFNVFAGSKNHDEMANIIRNAMSQNQETSIVISDKNYVLRKRVFQILEVDVLENHFKEFTLLDLEVGMPLVVDLTYAQADYITSINLCEDQIIIASCISVVTKNGLTEQWHLLNIDEIIN